MDSGLGEAVRAYSRGDWAGCLALLDRVDATDTDHLELAYLLGLVHVRLEHWDTALLYLEQIVTGSDEFLRVCQSRLLLAYVYSKTGRSRLAEYELSRLIASGFESVQTCAGLGFAAWAQGKTDEAIHWYSRALDIDPDNANALNGLGFVLATSGRDLARAMACCRQAVSKVPDNAAYLDSLGWACFKSGRMDEARDFIARALSLAPDEGEILDHARAVAGLQ
jgi:tetratricopeptide (TPR) repeat protein